MKKDIKYLIENNIVNFNPIDYSDEGSDIISYDNIKKTAGIPYTLKDLKSIIKQRIKENPRNPYLRDIDTSLIKSMRHLFNFNNDLQESIEILDLSTWDTSNVKNMEYMFYGLTNVKEIKFSKKFDTSKVINMQWMFDSCTELTALDLSYFNTSNVKNMENMFCYCSSLKELNLKNFDTSNVTNMKAMLEYCSSLISIDLSNFDTSNVKSFNHMFTECTLLEKLDLSNFSISGDIAYMFSECTSLRKLNLTGWDLDNVDETYGMFTNCDSLSLKRIKTTDPKIKQQFLKDNDYE